MKEEEFQKKVINKLNGIDKRIRNIEKRLEDMEAAMNSVYEAIEDEDDYEEDISTIESEGRNIIKLPSHKDLKGYI